MFLSFLLHPIKSIKRFFKYARLRAHAELDLHKICTTCGIPLFNNDPYLMREYIKNRVNPPTISYEYVCRNCSSEFLRDALREKLEDDVVNFF